MRESTEVIPQLNRDLGGNLPSSIAAPEPESRVAEFFKPRRIKEGVAGLVGAVCVSAAYLRYGTEIDLDALKGLDIAEKGRGIIEFSESASPYVLSVASAGVLSMAASRPGRKILKMGYEGLNTPKHPGRIRRAMSGMMLSALGIGALGTAFMINDGVQGGSESNIEAMSSAVSSNYPGMEVKWGIQPGTGHFMNNSRISTGSIDSLNNELSKVGGGAAPFGFDLAMIPTKHNKQQAGAVFSVNGSPTSPALSLLPDVKGGALCDKDRDGRCDQLPSDGIIVDQGEGFEMGGTVQIKGRDYHVVGFSAKDQSLLNRLVAFTGVDTKNPPQDYYGVVTVVKDEADLMSAVGELGLGSEIEFKTPDQLIESNKDFWSHNGTPLIILLIADISVFAAASFSAIKSSDLQRSRAVVAGLQAIGATRYQVAQMQLADATIKTGKGVLPGAAGAIVTTSAINNMLPGFEGHVTAPMVAGSVGIILLAQVTTAFTQGHLMAKTPLVDRMKSK